jgi:sulfoacetaldehyde acetyltransferase
MHISGIEHAFGIIGSAMMPISDLFPKAGITFWDCGHEGNAGYDGRRLYPRLGQDVHDGGPERPGHHQLCDPVKTAYWNHTPLLLVTPQAANMTMGQGGFQEVPQMALFEEMVAYQEEVLHPARMAEVLNRVILQAKRASAPAQINVPRDFWTQVMEIELPPIVEFERAGRRRAGHRQAAELLSECQIPGHPQRRRGGHRRCHRGPCGWPNVWMPRSAAATSTTTPFPGSHPLFAGPWGTTDPRPAWS